MSLDNWRVRKMNLLNMCQRSFAQIDLNNRFMVIIDNPEDIYYYTRYWGEGILVISNDYTSILIVPRLEHYRAIESSTECEITPSERGKSMFDSILALIENNVTIFYGGSNYGFINEISKGIRKENLKIETELLLKIREIKDSDEIDKIQKASNIIDKLFDIASKEIKQHVSEEEIQAILVFEALRMGARFPSYQFTSNPLIVASGPNGSFPHAETSNRKIQDGDLVVLDITLSYDHYVSDATRTFGIGILPYEMKKAYGVVQQAQQKGIEKIGTTNDFSEIDLECRTIINKAGYGEKFIHSTGHGIGLEVHELPWIRPSITSPIKTNMTITIEPGIYAANTYGIRIEDSLLIKSKSQRGADGFEYLNFHSFNKELIIL